MKVLSQARRICGYQLRILRGNYKLYLIPVCLFVYMLNELIPIRDFLFSVNEKASPFLLPFIFNDVMLTASIFVAAMLFFIDAPFYDKYQLFVIMRGGTSEWVLGHIMYIFSVYVVSDRNKYFDYFSQRLSERGMGADLDNTCSY